MKPLLLTSSELRPLSGLSDHFLGWRRQQRAAAAPFMLDAESLGGNLLKMKSSLNLGTD